MKLKDFLDKKRNALLEKERKQAEAERQRQEAEARRLAGEAVEPHPLRGRDALLLDDYALAQLVLRNEGETLDTEGKLLHPFAIALGISLEHFSDLQEKTSLYDEVSNCEVLEKVCGELKEPEEIICFLCDLVKLHGEEYALEGDFLDLWRSVSMGLFQVGSEKTALMERLCARIAKRERRKRGDDFGDIPEELVQYYLTQQVALNGQYLVIDLSGGANASQYPVRFTDEPPKLGESACRTTELWLRRIPAGSFTIGSPQNELGRKDNEMQHRVTLTRDYYIGVFQCTQRQYELVMGNNPSHFKGADNPVEQVSYNTLRGTYEGSKWPAGSDVDENSFFGRLQERTGLALDLPTEAEWEYACRAGTMTALNSGKNLTIEDGNCSNLDEVGWYRENSGGTTHPVGQKKPNVWGLYDMHGNVWEWCLDWYEEYSSEAVSDPVGDTWGEYRAYRGGSWCDYAQNCRSAGRSGDKASRRYSYIGFRVAFRS